MVYNLDKLEKDILKKLLDNPNLIPVLNRLDAYLSKDNPKSYINAFNKIHDVIKASQVDVEKNLENEAQKRKRQDNPYNKDQARRSIVGYMFPSCIIYLFIHNKIIGNIKPNIFIVSSKKAKVIKNFEEASTIKIGQEDTQKPDFDLVIFSQKIDSDKEAERFIIISVKTSMRERAGQTYKWKLLLEIATEKDSNIKNKYDIVYEPKQPPLICFATVNFYNEINNPQQRGMLKFFDKAFLAKELNEPSDFINPLSDIVDFVNEKMDSK